MLVSLALGISLTIGLVALFAIVARKKLSADFAARLPGLERGVRLVQGIAGTSIIVIGLYALSSLRF